MADGVALQKILDHWEFPNEVALESFVWNDLPALLNLNPLKRQYAVKGEVCDIIAVNGNKQLVVVELKNGENRYVVQQLTRYYANLIQEKTLSDQIDYSLPVRLIAIAPTYHRHNFIDQEYSRLQIELLKFLVVKQDSFCFQLFESSGEFVSKVPIPFQEVTLPLPENLPPPPEQLLGWLGSLTEAEYTGFLRVRNQLLSCSDRMKEVVERHCISYGAGKMKPCAEIRFEPKSQRPVLFLWLPTPSSYKLPLYAEGTNGIVGLAKTIYGRLRLWTDGTTISHVGHIPEGFGKMKLREEWEQIPLDKRPKRGLTEGKTRNCDIPCQLNLYLQCGNQDDKPDYWEVLPQMAIARWLERL